MKLPQAKKEQSTPIPNSNLSFLKRDIPSYDEYPDINMKLMQLYHNREGYGEKLREAIHDGNHQMIERLQRFTQQCNDEMHEIFLAHLRDNEPFHSAPSSPTHSSDDNDGDLGMEGEPKYSQPQETSRQHGPQSNCSSFCRRYVCFIILE